MLLLAQNYKPILQNSIKHIEQLLKEIMDAGISKLNISNTVRIEEVFLQTFSNIQINHKACQVEIEYKIELKNFLIADEVRIVRVFKNLILHSVELMNFKGKIFIHAKRKTEKNFAEILIGNNNSFINPVDIKHIFEPFYIKNNKNGNNLKIPIAEKIIHLHGGSISCLTDEKKGVEFIITLPLGEEILTSFNYDLPKKLIVISSKDKKFGQNKEGSNEAKTIAEDRILTLKNKIIIIDDDPFIGRIWKRTVTDAEVFNFLYPEDFLKEIKEKKDFINKNTIIISDLNFGSESKLDFYNFVLELRNYYFETIFLSTDSLDEEINLIFLKKYKIFKIDKNIYLFSELISKNENKVNSSGVSQF